VVISGGVEARMPERWEKIAYWRQRAEELRQAADDVAIPSARDRLSALAEQYAHMAAVLERELRDNGIGEPHVARPPDSAVIAPDEIATPQLRQLYEAWCAHHIDGKLPARLQIEPLELKFLLGNLLIVDVGYAPLRFRFRLFGGGLAMRLKHDWSGRFLDTYPDAEFRCHLQKVWEGVVTVGRPIANTRRMIFDGRSYRYDGMVLPLSSDGEKIDGLLVGVVPHEDGSASQ